MHLFNLPLDYKILALRAVQAQWKPSYWPPHEFNKTGGDLKITFVWHRTPEGVVFWNSVYDAETREELPPISEPPQIDYKLFLEYITAELLRHESP